mmetsp:Transcript_22109/g.50530  ORF Transcript_22109/g.50530 Transcript_22109/m.50530 type:complete len:270 (-) Transcript_22109:73-882(-)
MPELDRTESFLQSAEDPLSVSIMYGTITGSSCVLIGYPLDTVKVRLQMGHPVDWKLLAKPYRGVMSPLLAVPPSWSSSFLLYGIAIKGLGDDSLTSVTAAGAITGLGYTAVVCPFEMVKCNTQGTQVPLRQTFQRLRAEHGPSVMYRGVGACLCRDVGQLSAYYFLAELFGRSERLQSTFGDQAPFVAGMLTGLGHCHVELPFDCMKTRMQTNLACTGYAELLRELFRDGPAAGVRGLFKGYVPWMLRAMICHGSSFYLLAKVRALTGW